MSACFDNRNSDDAHPLPVRCENAAVGPVASATHISESCVNSIPTAFTGGPVCNNNTDERGEVWTERTTRLAYGMLNYQERMKAIHALHAYESLEALEDDGDEDAVNLREKLFEQYIDAWEELKPAVVGSSR